MVFLMISIKKIRTDSISAYFLFQNEFCSNMVIIYVLFTKIGLKIYDWKEQAFLLQLVKYCMLVFCCAFRTLIIEKLKMFKKDPLSGYKTQIGDWLS